MSGRPGDNHHAGIPQAWPRDRRARLLLALLVAGLLVGSATHIENIARAGLVPRPELPLACNLFWTALVVIDPLVALALLRRPRTGIVLLLGLMALDLSLNLAFLGIGPAVVAQLAYTALALAAAPIILSRRDHGPGAGMTGSAK
jgi:hypothetical protein